MRPTKNLQRPWIRRAIFGLYNKLAVYAGEFLSIHDKIIIKHQINKGHLSLGRYTYGLTSTTLSGACLDWPVHIGSFCSFAPGVRILAGVDHPIDLPSTYPFKTLLFADIRLSGPRRPNADVISKGGITIGSDVWIGQNVIILSGTTIGHGAVIGAGAVVTDDIPAYGIALGVPARVKKYRFDNETVNILLTSRWWELSADELLIFRSKLYDQDVRNFAISILSWRNLET